MARTSKPTIPVVDTLSAFDQRTALSLQPCCTLCGSQGISTRRDGYVRCDGCHTIVTHVEVPIRTQIITVTAAIRRGAVL